MPWNLEGYDARDLVEQLLSVVDKETRRDIEFLFNNVQNKFYNEMTFRDIILKARQQGFSTLILALFLMACICIRNTSAVVISHEKKATQRLLARVHYFIKHMEVKPQLERANQGELYFPKTESVFYIGTAGAKAFGQGDTITLLHASEYPRWPNTGILSGILECIPQSGTAIIETTADKFGDIFHQMWKRTKNKGFAWKGHFYGWHMLNSNRRRVPPGFILKGVSDKTGAIETELMKEYGLDLEQMAWRRWKVETMPNPEEFPKWHPINDQEAFLMAGKGVFEKKILQRWYNLEMPFVQGEIELVDNCPRFNEDENGYFKIFEFEEAKSGDKIVNKPQSQYVLFLDVMEGIEIEGLTDQQLEKIAENRDWHALSVKDRQTWKTVATYRSQEDDDIIAMKVNAIGRYFNNALVGVEQNIGRTVLYILKKEYSYPNLYYDEVIDEDTEKIGKKLGWRATSKSKPHIIGLLKRAIRQNTTKVYDLVVIDELMSYIKDKAGKFTAPAGMNDDCVIAEAGAIYLCERNPYLGPEAPGQQNAQFNRSRVSG